MVKPSTLSRSTRLLLESGALSADPVARLVGARDLVLSRALCRFRLYRPPNPLSGALLAKAARAYAEAHAPFADTGVLILRAARSAEIWYWDRSKLSAHAPVGQVSPESVWRAASDGWRIVACAEGFEAQYWEANALIASTWRRQAFAVPQWAAFTLSVDAPVVAPPAEPPAPETLPLVSKSWRARTIRDPLTWRDAEKAGTSVAICGVAVAALFCGQALHAAQITAREQARAATAEQALRADDDAVRALQQRQLIQAFATATAHPPVLAAAVDAHEVLSRFGLRAGTWRASADGVSVIVDAPISEAPVRDIVSAMEETPNLCAAVPEIAGAGRFEVRAMVAAPGRACPEAETRERR